VKNVQKIEILRLNLRVLIDSLDLTLQKLISYKIGLQAVDMKEMIIHYKTFDVYYVISNITKMNSD